MGGLRAVTRAGVVAVFCLVVGGVGVFNLLSWSAPAATEIVLPGQAAAVARKGLPVQLTGALLREGMRLIPWASLLEVNARANFTVRLQSLGVTGQFEVSTGQSDDERALVEAGKRFKSETNAILKQQLLVMIDTLKEQKERNRLLREQTRVAQHLLDLQIRAFDYQKWVQEEAILRKKEYSVPVDKLVVVVADFSSGNQDEGREVADEIAHHLTELSRNGLDIHVLNGEIRPGVAVRSEEMARDIGRHFPGTDFVVVWGSMSPRTVGRYRPHLTCVQYVKGAKAASVTTSINLDPGELPEKGKAEAYQRACYERLIGATCAAIPSLYAAYQIRRDKVPQLSGIFKLLGDEQPETKQLKAKLLPLTRWAKVSSALKATRLCRLSDISSDRPFPLRVVNEKDGSLMALVTDEKGEPRKFYNEASKKQEYVYVDVLETTVSQFIRFLNASGGNKKGGGHDWLYMKSDVPHWDIAEEKGTFIERPDAKRKEGIVRGRLPVTNMSWFGAVAYCEWAGKSLPRREEWQAAAEPQGGGEFPWGKDGASFARLCNAGNRDYHLHGGSRPRDCSRVGCFDMAGNVAEWCADWFDEKAGKRMVMGGHCEDTEVANVKITAKKGEYQTNYDWKIGFRGVVRIPVDLGQD
ncbi:MAG: formylglycine-generating enzyme family protein [Alphaproteobacteria bacterium]|nr:MAG: formylglycine-generating enzyme family protein [Alphaproteobacteria bacterium]